MLFFRIFYSFSLNFILIVLYNDTIQVIKTFLEVTAFILLSRCELCLSTWRLHIKTDFTSLFAVWSEVS